MPRNRKPICFIAMAFGREDTDLFYERQILPTLKKNNVSPVIINRRVSNDDINVQIIEQLERADFCIADLTYTRPSVYFEAGFAQRSIPVIYTVRKDHLLEGQPEDLRVHFDLKMKPIIDWENPNDSTFSKRLERRIKSTIISSWVRENKKQIKYENAIKEFEELSLSDRLSLMQRRAIYSMRKIGISLSKWQIVYPFYYPLNMTTVRSTLTQGKYHYITAMEIKSKNARCISIQSYETVTKGDIEKLYSVYFSRRSRSFYITTSDFSKFNSIFTDVIVLCLKPVPKNRIENVLKYANVIKPSKCYFEESVEKHRVSKSYEEDKYKNVEMKTRIHFLSNIKSDLHLKQELDNLIDEYLII